MRQPCGGNEGVAPMVTNLVVLAGDQLRERPADALALLRDLGGDRLFLSLLVSSSMADAEREYLDQFRLLGVPVLVRRPASPERAGLVDTLRCLTDTVSLLRATHQHYACLPPNRHQPVEHLACLVTPGVRIVPSTVRNGMPAGRVTHRREAEAIRAWWSAVMPTQLSRA
jgi:hypothetical protein